MFEFTLTPPRARPAPAPCRCPTARCRRRRSCRSAPTARCADSTRPRSTGPAPRSSSATPTTCTSAPARRSSARWAGCIGSRPGTGRCSPTRADSRSSRSRGSARIDEDGVEFVSHIDGSRPDPHPRVGDGDPVGARRRHRDGVRSRGAGPGPAGAGRGGDGADPAVAGAVRGRHDELAGGREGGTAGSEIRPPSRPPALPPRRCGPSSRAAPTPTSGSARLEGTLARGHWTGIAIGGLSVGEPKPVMHRVLEELGPALPAGTSPVILWASDFPEDLVEGIARGVDLFDCVAATRNGRHGSAWTDDRQGQHPERVAPDRRGAARPGVRLRDLPDGSPGAISATCSWRRRCSASGWCRFTTCGSCSASASRPAPRSWTGTFDTLEPRLAPALPRQRSMTRVMPILLPDGRRRRSGGGSMAILLFQIGAIGLVFYFLAHPAPERGAEEARRAARRAQEGRRDHHRGRNRSARSRTSRTTGSPSRAAPPP